MFSSEGEDWEAAVEAMVGASGVDGPEPGIASGKAAGIPVLTGGLSCTSILVEAS
jgi:hypothetical protein